MFSVPSLPRASEGRCHPSTDRKLQVLRILNHFFPGSQFHIRFLPVVPKTLGASPAAKFSMINRGAHAVELHLEDALDRLPDFRLRGFAGNLKDDRMLRLLHAESLLRDDR